MEQHDLPLAPPATVRATSRVVFEQIRTEGLLYGARLRALEILVDSAEPLTGAEVDAIAGAATSPIGHAHRRGHLHKRLPELRRVGVVMIGDARKCKVTGRVAVTWAVSGRLPDTPKDRPVPNATIIAGLRAELAAAHAEIRQLQADLHNAQQTSARWDLTP